MLFTIPIWILGVVIIFVFIKSLQDTNQEKYIERIAAISVFALALGVLGQVIGLVEGFKVMEELEGISPQILAGGLKNSATTTIWGLIVFLVGRLLIIVLQWKK